MPLPASILLGLTRRYCEPHRRYHTIGHVADMLWRGRELELDDNQVLAIWYHDAIFDVPSQGNERRSAALAREELAAAGLAASDVDVVERIVLDTEQHVPTLEAAHPVLDLDLMTLGGAWERFCANTEALRGEFASLGAERFDAGQRRMCERFLGRERIFQTEWGSQFELPARQNLERWLAENPAS